MDKEIPKAPFLRTGKDEDCVWIEFFSGQHGSEGVEIRIRMGRNDFHLNRRYTLLVNGDSMIVTGDS